MTGRPTKLLEADIRERLLEAIEHGALIEDACEYAGIDSSTYRRWMVRGREAQARFEETGTLSPDDEEFLHFLHEATRAHARGRVHMVGLLRKIAEGGYVTKSRTTRYRDPVHGVVEVRDDDFAPPDIRAVIFYLERRYSEAFGKQAMLPVELAGPGGGPVEVGGTNLVALAERVTSQAAMLREAYEAGWPNGEGVPLVTGQAPTGRKFPQVNGTGSDKR